MPKKRQIITILSVAMMISLIFITDTISLSSQLSSASKDATTSNVIFKEDFESYPLGKFENSTNWKIYTTWYANPDDQRIVNTASISGTKSLQVMSTNEQDQANGIIIRRTLSKSSNLIGFQIFAMLLGDGLLGFDLAGDWSTEGGLGWAGLADVSFRYKTMVAGDTSNWIFTNAYSNGKYDWIDLQNYDTDRWYKIDSIIDTSTLEFKIWIDDEFKGIFNEHPNRVDYPIDSFIFTCHFGEKAYIDDIIVYEGLGEPIPEFLSFLILPLFMISTLLATMLYRILISSKTK